MIGAKPFDIPKREVWEAFKRVKANQGAAGVDGQSIQDFEARLGDNLYKLWNRLSSGSYMPPPVRRVDIPKASGGTRPLGIPTVADRVAQEVVRRYLEPLLEPMFHEDSYGYRPVRSAIDAIRTARQRCWRSDWVVDIDIKGFFDALKANPGAMSVGGGSAGGTDHIALGLMLKALGRSAREASYVAFAGGGPAQAAIMGGQVKAGISGLSEFAEQIKGGRMRALATTGAERIDPAIPTLKESGLDVVLTNWRGVFGAPGLRPEAREALVRLMTEMHVLPAWKETLNTRGWADAFLTGPELDAFLERDRAQTEAVLKEIGLA